MSARSRPPTRKARGDGIHVYRVDPATGGWTHVQHVGNLVNPSYLALSHDQRVLYSVHGDSDFATAFALDPKTGEAKPLGRAATGGKNGVRQALDPSGKYLVVANYSSGSVAVLPIGPDGALKDQHQLVQLPGEPGPHKVEQQSSHPHDIVFDPSGTLRAGARQGARPRVRVPLRRRDRQAHPDRAGLGAVAARRRAAPRRLPSQAADRLGPQRAQQHDGDLSVSIRSPGASSRCR